MTNESEIEREKRITAELDAQSLQGLLDPREAKPTTVMRRDELLPLVDAITPIASSEHVVPRALLGRRDKIASSGTAPIAEQDTDIDIRSGASRIVILVLLGLFVGLFVAILATAR